jgi:threonylcarbamoyladenosine tRNA methylthiotransferase MtaB
MCRQYGAEELREKIALIKSRLDRPAITCDIIVGFPGETEEDFQQTVELAKWAGFSKMHIFPFSARAGTAAAKMKERVQPKVVKERAEVLSRLGDCLGRQFREQFIGEECEVLLENDEPMSGRCERYFLVKVNSKKQIVKSEFGLATEIFSHRGHRDHRDKNEKQIYNNLVPLCLGGKGEIVKVKITGATGEGTTAEAANSKY